MNHSRTTPQSFPSEVDVDSIVQSQVPTVISFEKPWCRALLSGLDDVVQPFAGRLHLVRVNVDAEPKLAERFKVRVAPTLLLFKENAPVAFVVGLVTPEFLLETLAEVIGMSLVHDTTGKERTPACFH